MFGNTLMSQKPFFDVAQLMTNMVREVTQANLQWVNSVSKACFEVCSAGCRTVEETAQQVGKAAQTQAKA